MHPEFGQAIATSSLGPPACSHPAWKALCTTLPLQRVRGTAGKLILAEPGTVGKTSGPPPCLANLAVNAEFELCNAYGGCVMRSDGQNRMSAPLAECAYP